MKTPCGDIDDSWESVIGDSGSMMMLDVIKTVCKLGEDCQLFADMQEVPLSKLKAVVIVDRTWGPYGSPVRYDESFPPEPVTNIGKFMGAYPNTASWTSQGVVSLAYPMYHPAGQEGRFRPVWEGWLRQLLKGLSARKKTNKYAFVLMGRNSHKLKSSIAMAMPLVMSADPTTWDYVKEGVCAFKAITNKASLEISW